MPLEPKQTLTHYEILAPLGKGGMGEVWRARDTRLDREVAIKVLPEHLAADADRLQRFEREAKTLATLSHANVAQVYGIDQVDDTCFMAMELVEGEDLGERLKRGRLPIDEALEVCAKIAEGLEAAHEAGVVHRDLKPANVRVSPTGEVKVLDFGLAKPMKPKASGSGTSTAQSDSFLATEEGLVLGTPTYMSPEQARGRAVDRRTDVWAFGCVLFECLSGKRVFGGETFSDVMAAIVEREPNWSLLPSKTPPRVRELLERCLAKDPRQRLRDVGEARVLLSDPSALISAAGAMGTAGPRRSPALAVGLLALAGAVLASAWWLRPGAAVEPPKLRLSTALSANEALHNDHYPSLLISPDGTSLAWVGGPHQRLMTRALDSYDVLTLADTDGAHCPTFSPDGEWLAYFVDDRIYKVRATGGQPVLLVVESEHAEMIPGYGGESRGIAWGADGWLTFSPAPVETLFRVRDTGGEVERLTTRAYADDERTHRWPQAIDEANAILFTVDDGASPEFYDDARIEVVDLATGERRVVLGGASMARYAAGSLVFARAGQLFHQQLDLETWTLAGQALPVISSVATEVSSGAVHFDLSRDGTLVYAPGDRYDQEMYFAWTSLDGEREDVGIEPGAVSQPALTPDEKRIAYLRASSSGTNIWVHDVERGTSQRVTGTLGAKTVVWAPDGEHLVFTLGTTLYRHRVGSLAEPEPLYEHESTLYPYEFVDERTLLLGIRREETHFDIAALDTESGELRDLLAEKTFDVGARRSPDGELLAYASTVTGHGEIYLTRWGDTSVSWQVSDKGAAEPHWSPDGTTLYYLRPSEAALWGVDVEPGNPPRLSPPRRLAEDFFFDFGYRPSCRVLRSGRFLTVQSDQEDRSAPRELRVLPGWVAEQARAVR